MSVLRLPCFGTLLAAALVACTTREAPPPNRLVDEVGHPVALEAPARRIVSLSPSTTELLFAIGAGASVVGRTRWCDFPPDVATVPSVGDGLNPNLELVLSRTPDLVVFYASAANQGVITRLDGLGLAAASVRLDRLDDLPRVARLLGRLTGATARADSLATRFAAALDSARAAARAATPAGAQEPVQRVVVVSWDNPPIIIGAGSFLTELIEMAGARNVFDDVVQPSAQVGIETIATRDPDVLLVLGEGVPGFARRPEWQNVGAVRRRSFVAVQGSEFERPGFRSLEAVRRLRAALSRSPVR